ncbi:MAG: ParA family protein [Blastocatellia bacterium]
MSIPVIAFFNNKGGVGKTSLVYHLSWMYADLGLRVVAADLDPQANLTAAFLDEERLLELWPETSHTQTIFGAVQPLIKATGDIGEPHLEPLDDRLALLAGDLALSAFEDQLSEVWPKCNDGDERSFRVMSAFWRVLQKAATAHHANVILTDLGPNLGAINRAALIAADYVVVPLSPDLFSLQGLRNLGPTLRRWREGWTERLRKNPARDLDLPQGRMEPAGYIVLQHPVRLDRPVLAYDRWIERIPQIWRTEIRQDEEQENATLNENRDRLALLRHYAGLMPLAQEAHKPIFHLKPAEGATGAHISAVKNVRDDFARLAREIATRTQLALPAIDQ